MPYAAVPAMIDALWPPKPKLLLITASSLPLARRVRRVVQIARRVGRRVVDRRRADAVAAAPSCRATSSTPPLAPSRWPSWLLVLEMLTLWAWSPKTVLMAIVSALSPSGVLVPWALM